MNLFAIQSIVTSGLAILLGTFALAKNWKRKSNIIWFFVSLSISLWSLGLGLEVISPNENWALIWNRVLYIGAIFLPAFFYHFTVELIGIEKKRKKTVLFAYFFSSFFVALNFTTPLFVSGVPPVAGFNYWVSVGPLYLPYFFGFTGIFLYSFVTLLYYIPKVSKVKKNQAKFLLFGSVIGFLGGVTNFFPQLISIYPFGNYFVAAYMIFITYAIVKHRLMDIRLIVARSIAYAILLATLAFLYAGGVLGIEWLFFRTTFNQINLVQGIIRAVLAVIIAFTFQPLRKWITKKTDRIFFKNAYDPQVLLDELSHTMGSTIVLIELLYKVTDILIQQMKVSRGLFVLLKDDKAIYTIQANGYRENPKVDVDDAIKIARDGTAVYDELEESSQYKELLRKYEAAVSIPLKTEKEIVGVLLIGEKSSGDMFNQQDLRILEIIAPEVSVAIENAKSFEEISRFNVTLRQEVTRATHRLKEKNQQLRELDKAKDEFISMASHQLRTPLTAIKGYLSMLLDGDAGEIKVGQFDFIHEAYSGANRMVDLINDLLNVSRMDTGRFFIEPVEVDIEAMVKEEIEQLMNQATDKGLALKLEKKGPVPHIWADETKIRQVVMNFIDNAIHYTYKGSVTVKLGKEKGEFVFTVTDTGIGVPLVEQAKLFDKFYRADNARHVRPDGTGLGIYLAKKIVEDHNGSITFESKEGKGSTFGFKLPLKKEAVLEAAKTSLPPAPVEQKEDIIHKPLSELVSEEPMPRNELKKWDLQVSGDTDKTE
ncbi:MAG: ATP-binding protein [Patescibacteria group bacterium]|nr:ATP-binding protein [Patescibacteria group bacterium]